MASNQEQWDALLYPGTHTLRNLPGIRDAEEWDFLESQLGAVRLQEIPLIGFVRETIADEIRAYHHHIFQDCYEWAGRFRTFNMSKENALTGEPSMFCPADAIESRLQELDAVRASLDECDFDEQIVMLAYIHSELNEIHPFREGNGRTTRELMTRLSARYDINLDWTDAHAAQLYASQLSMSGDQLDSTPWITLYQQIASQAQWEDTEPQDFFDALTGAEELRDTEADNGLSILDVLDLSPVGTDVPEFDPHYHAQQNSALDNIAATDSQPREL